MELNLQHTATGINLKHIANDSINYAFQILDNENNLVNFSGYTHAKMSIKENEFSTAIVTFHSTGTSYQINLTEKTAGRITIIANSTSLIPVGSYLYDIELYNSTLRETIVSGKIIVLQDIS